MKTKCINCNNIFDDKNYEKLKHITPLAKRVLCDNCLNGIWGRFRKK